MFSKIFGKDLVKQEESRIWVFGTFLLFGLVGLLASFVLTVDEITVLKNPDAVLSCSFNLVLNCGTVMQTNEASLFGFPNMLIGLMGFPVILAFAVLGLSRVTFPKWFLIAMQTGLVLGVVFAYWLFFSSVYVIQVLCPWCLTVTTSMTVLFAAITHYNLRLNTFDFKKSTQKSIEKFLDKDWDKFIVALWLVAMVGLVFIKFGKALFA